MLKDELYHKWTDAMKANYNREYYQKHKEWWKTKYADFTGGVKRAAANAKETVKGETPQSLWKSGAQSIRDTKIPGIKRVSRTRGKGNTTEEHTSAVTLGEAIDDMKGSKRTLSGQPKGFVENWKAGAKGIRDKADPYLKEGKKKAKSAKNLWDDGAKDVKIAASKASTTAKKGAQKLSSILQKSGKQAIANIEKASPKVVSAGRKAAAAVLAVPIAITGAATATGLIAYALVAKEVHDHKKKKKK